MFSLLQWGCGLVLQKQTEQSFLFVSFCFFAVEILKWRELCRCFSVRGWTFPWFGERNSSLLSWAAATSVFLGCYGCRKYFHFGHFCTLEIPVAAPQRRRVQVLACTGSEWHLVLSLLGSSALGTTGLTLERCSAGGAGMWPGWTKGLFVVKWRDQILHGTLFAVTSAFLLLAAVRGYLTSLAFSFCSKLQWLPSFSSL